MIGPDDRTLCGLALSLFGDLAAVFPTLQKGLQRDVNYFTKRFDSEGLAFLTVSLPKLGKALDRWLKDESGALDFSSAFFAPQFLAGYRDLVQNPGTHLQDRAYLYRWLRQLAYLMYKLEVPPTDAQLAEAFAGFERRNEELYASDAQIDQFKTGGAAELIGEVLSGFTATNLHPKHGPGSVATGETGDLKWSFKRKYATLHRRFPMYDYFVPSPTVWRADTRYILNWYRSLETIDHPESRVIAVPKDSRGPRLICAEPLELQFMQQGYASRLVSILESHPLTAGKVNFKRQDINQRLAIQGSISGEWATIDLSDASDRVSDYLVYLLYPEGVYRDLAALRSRRAVLPSGKRITLQMHAPMGSCNCFPVEAMTFWAIALSAIRDATKCSDGEVYVYGDDIIVPTEHAPLVCEALETFGLRVNREKSYYTGLFRESCGVDAWAGFNLTPARVRRFPPSKISNHETLTNWVAASNLLREHGFPIAADTAKAVIDRVVDLPWNIHGTPLSYQDSTELSTGIDDRNSGFRTRWNPRKCRQQTYCHFLKQKKQRSTSTGWQRLHRNLLVMPRDPDHWAPRGAVQVRKGWIDNHPF